MLTGNEKIKDLQSDDICNYLGNSLSRYGIKEVSINNSKSFFGQYRVLFIVCEETKYYKKDFIRISFVSEKILNASIEEVKRIIEVSRIRKAKY